MNNYMPIPKNDRAHHAPLRTITELADEFGVTRNALVKFLAHSKNAPKQVLKAGTARAHTINTWYKPNEVRTWWKQFLIDRPDVKERLKK